MGSPCRQDPWGIAQCSIRRHPSSLISAYLIDGCEDSRDAGHSEELLEVGDDALQQAFAIASCQALCGRQGVCQRCAPVLSLHKAPHSSQHAV